VKIEFLYWEECPSHPETLARLQEVLKEAGVDAPVELIHVETDDQAVTFKFPGSPTIRIDGTDLFPVPDMVVGLSCRVYHTPDGRAKPLPTKEMIRKALQERLTTKAEGRKQKAAGEE
jgi:hypothetical protein